MVSDAWLPSKNEVDEANKKWVENGPSRSAKWWYLTFHTLAAMIGTCILGLPSAMAHLGWGPGICVLLLSWSLTLYTLWEMIQLHECVEGTRFDRYVDLGRHAFGPKLGPWIVLPQQLIVQVGCNIVYMVVGGQCLNKFMEKLFTDCSQIRQSYWIIIFAFFQFILSQLPNFNYVAALSFVSAVMSFCYSTIAWVTCLRRGQIENVRYSYKEKSTIDVMFRAFNSLGLISFAFTAHSVALEIQATVPSTTEKPSKKKMWKGAFVAYFISTICYFPTAFIGYWAFGQAVNDNVLLSLERPPWLIATANLMLFCTIVGSYQVYAMPVFDLIERKMSARLKLPPGPAHRLIARCAYVALTLFIGVTFPFFGDLLGFFGGFGSAPTSFSLPSLMWLIIKKPKRFSINWFINWFAIYIGLCIMLASVVGGFRNIYADASTFTFYT